MRTSRRSRTFTSRLAALSAAVGAAALVGLGSTGAHAAPTTTAATTAARTTTAATTTAATTTAATTTAATTTAATTTPATTTPAPTSTGERSAPGPQCPGVGSVLTPVVCIPTGSGEDQPAPVGTDGFLEFAGQVVNNGPAVSAATVVITLPKGLRLDDPSNEAVNRLEQWWDEDSDEDGTPLACTTSEDGSVVTCATGSIPAGANFLVLIDLDAQDNAVAGTSGKLTLALQSSPTLGTFPATSVQATVDFVGTAHLQVRLTPANASVTVGKSLTLTATIHNGGPNAAVEAAAFGFVSSGRISDDQPFTITNSQPFPGQDSGSTGASASAFLLRSLPTRMAAAKRSSAKTAAGKMSAAKRSSAKTSSAKTSAGKMSAGRNVASDTSASFGFWPVGTIAVGATASVQVVVKAEYVGQVQLFFDATSADESCDEETSDCENTATAALSAVAAVTTTATTAPATTVAATTSTQSASAVSATGSSPAAASLPNTGFRPAPWLGSAGAAILLGVGLMVLGAPRRRSCGRYR